MIGCGSRRVALLCEAEIGLRLYKELAVLAELVQVALPDILLRRHVIFASL